MADDLTGVWDGTYIQPSVGMVTFLTTLIETGGALTRKRDRPCLLRACPLRTHNASITGHRSGNAVSFVKNYEPPGYGYDKVFYEGTVNADATEISGRWRLPGVNLGDVSDGPIEQDCRIGRGRKAGQGTGALRATQSLLGHSGAMRSMEPGNDLQTGACRPMDSGLATSSRPAMTGALILLRTARSTCTR